MNKYLLSKTHVLGFTIIEVLVAATIISILATIGFASYSSANRRGRNTKRSHDLEQIRNAEEMYKVDTPAVGYTPNVGDLVSGSYLSSAPHDPKFGGTYPDYSLTSGGATYCVCASLETPPAPPSSSTSCPPSGSYNYCLSNP